MGFVLSHFLAEADFNIPLLLLERVVCVLEFVLSIKKLGDLAS